MPIRINLLAEALAEEDLRRRDPVKRAIGGGAILVALSLVWFSSIVLTYVVKNQSLNSLEASIGSHTNDYALVKNNLRKMDEIRQRMDSLDQLSAARFLQGNVMNALQQTYVPNVQLTRVHVSQDYTVIPALLGKPGAPGHPASVTEHVLLTLDAKDYSPNPGDQVQHFKDALLKQDYFNGCLGTNGIRMSGISPVQTPMDGKSYVMFSLECRYEDRKP